MLILTVKQNRRPSGAGGSLNLLFYREQDSNPTGKAAENKEANHDN